LRARQASWRRPGGNHGTRTRGKSACARGPCRTSA
jgi:hypothetical protein